MPRATNNVASRRRRQKILKLAKGFRGGRRTQIRTASDAVDRAGVSAYRDRRRKKRTFRALWITRINAAARLHGTTYSQLICGLTKADVDVNRKVMADLAVNSPEAFKALVETASAA